MNMQKLPIYIVCAPEIRYTLCSEKKTSNLVFLHNLEKVTNLDENFRHNS